MFRFSLQPALDAAAARERAAGAASAGACAVLEEARGATCVVAERAVEARSLCAALGGSAATAAAWIAFEEYGERLRRLRLVREHAVAVAEASARGALERFADLRRRRLALERLRERRLSEHRARAALRESAEYDESNAGRSRSAAGVR